MCWWKFCNRAAGVPRRKSRSSTEFSVVLLLQLSQQPLEVVTRAERFEHAVGLNPLGALKTFCNRLPQISERFVGPAHLGMDPRTLMPVPRVIGFELDCHGKILRRLRGRARRRGGGDRPR